jgi:hypothetical protein
MFGVFARPPRPALLPKEKKKVHKRTLTVKAYHVGRVQPHTPELMDIVVTFIAMVMPSLVAMGGALVAAFRLSDCSAWNSSLALERSGKESCS